MVKYCTKNHNLVQKRTLILSQSTCEESQIDIHASLEQIILLPIHPSPPSTLLDYEQRSVCDCCTIHTSSSQQHYLFPFASQTPTMIDPTRTHPPPPHRYIMSSIQVSTQQRREQGSHNLCNSRYQLMKVVSQHRKYHVSRRGGSTHRRNIIDQPHNLRHHGRGEQLMGSRHDIRHIRDQGGRQDAAHR